jgi:hypothetical protein
MYITLVNAFIPPIDRVWTDKGPFKRFLGFLVCLLREV